MRAFTDAELRLAEALLVDLQPFEVQVETSQFGGLTVRVPDRRDVSRVCDALSRCQEILGADDPEVRSIAVVVTSL